MSQFTRSAGFPLILQILAFSLLAAPLGAQNPFSVKKYTIDNGLPHNQITYINQDTTGFLWISTWDGLCRFDGYQMQSYYHRPEDSTSLPVFWIGKILIDKSNHVIVDCGNHAPVVYNPSEDCFKTLFAEGFTYHHVDICMGIDKTVWATNHTRLYQFDDSLEVRRTIRMVDMNSNPFYPNADLQLVIDNTNRPWLFLPNPNSYAIYQGTFLDNTMLQWNPVTDLKTRIFTTFNSNHDTETLQIQVTAGGETYLFSKFGLFLFNENTRSFIQVSTKPDPRLFSGTRAFFWGDGENGLNYIDTEKNQVFQIKMNAGSYIETAFVDRVGTLWVGNVSEKREDLGLYQYNPANPFFTNYLSGPDEQGDIRLVFSVLKDKQGNVWAGMRKDNYVYRISPDGETRKVDFSYALPPDARVKPRVLAADKEGFWIAGTNDYLLYYDYNTQKFTTREGPEIRNQIGGEPIHFHNALVDPDRLLFNGRDGIFSYDKENRVLKQVFKVDPFGTQFSFMRSADEGYWIGSLNNSVIKLDRNFKLEGTFFIGKEKTLAEHVCPGDSGDLWVALMGGGLGHLYPSTGRFEIFTTADGLSNNVLYSLLKDRNGNLWISTNQGISMFNPRSRFFRRFGREEGLVIDEFNSDSWFQAEDGEIFFGGVGGAVSFYPDSLLSDNQKYSKPALLITEFLAAGRPIYLGNLKEEIVTLKKGDDNLQVTFALLDFLHANRIKYRYRLLGADSEWRQCGFQNRRVLFDNLKPREYTLQIEATDYQGDWAYSTSMAIVIPKRIVEALWFRLLAMGLLGGILYWIVWLLIRTRRIAARQLEDSLRMESLRGQMNPHFIFNSLNSINYFISMNDKISANSFIADFSRLIRQTLENLSAGHVPFEVELSSVSDYLKLEHLRFGDRFSYHIGVDESIDPERLEVVPGLIQPFIENSIWHGIRGLQGRTGTVQVNFRLLRPDAVECSIEDDGVGCQVVGKTRVDLPGKKSQGIRIVRERLQLLSKTKGAVYSMEISDLHPERQETGTRVRVLIPVKTDKKIAYAT